MGMARDGQGVLSDAKNNRNSENSQPPLETSQETGSVHPLQ